MALDYTQGQVVRHYLHGADVPSHMLDEQAVAAIQWINGYRAHHKASPDEANLRDKFGVDAGELQALEDLLPKLTEDFAKRSFQPLMRQASETIAKTGSVLAGMEFLERGLLDLRTRMLPGLKHLPYIAGMEESLIRYARNSAEGLVPQIGTFNMAQLDHYTNGIEQGDYMIVYGRSSAGKSTLKRRMINGLVYGGLRVLSVTLEEPEDLERKKQQAIDAAVPLAPFIRHEMVPADLVRMQQELIAKAQETKGELFIEDRDSLRDTTYTEIARLVDKLRIDVVVIDQMTHWSTSLEWKDIVRASHDTRTFTLKHCPVIMLSQEDEKGGLKYGKALYEDATKVLRITPNPKQATDIKELVGEKNRGGIIGFRIPLQWAPGDSICEEQVTQPIVYDKPAEQAVAPDAPAGTPATAPADLSFGAF